MSSLEVAFGHSFFLIGYVCGFVFSSLSCIVVRCCSCHLLVLLSSLEVAFGHFLFQIGYVCSLASVFLIGCVRSLVFSSLSCIVIRCYSCHLLVLLSSVLIGYVCSLVFSSLSRIVVSCYSCHILVLLSSLEMTFGHSLL